jgi:hypothetical protein
LLKHSESDLLKATNVIENFRIIRQIRNCIVMLSFAEKKPKVHPHVQSHFGSCADVLT